MKFLILLLLWGILATVLSYQDANGILALYFFLKYTIRLVLFITGKY